METSEILSQLRSFNRDFPRAALEAAISRKDEITPELLRILDYTINRVEELDAEGGYMAHLYSMYLLAQFREPRTYPLLIRFASLPGDLIDSMMGDSLTEDFGRILASVSGGDLRGIQSLIENQHLYEWVRAVSLDAILTLVAEGQLDRDEAVRYFAELFHGKLEREPSQVWNELIAAASDLYPADLMDDIEQAYRDDLVDPYNINMDDVRRDLRLGATPVLDRLSSNPHHQMVRNTIDEMESWACFREEVDDEEPWDEEFDDEFFDAPDPVFVTPPIQRTSPKVGRNEPCPCGSGKKYKKCCGK